MTTPDHRFRGIHAEKLTFWGRCTCGWTSPPHDSTSGATAALGEHIANPED